MAASKKKASPKTKETARPNPSPHGEYLWVTENDVSAEEFPTAEHALANYKSTDDTSPVAICMVVARYEFGFIKK